MPTVMVVEQNARLRESVAMQLRNHEYIALEAEKVFYALAMLRQEKGPLDLISWGGTLSDENSCEDAIRRVQACFPGPMIAASKSQAMRKKQMAAGCTHAADFSPLHFAADLVALIMQLAPKPKQLPR